MLKLFLQVLIFLPTSQAWTLVNVPVKSLSNLKKFFVEQKVVRNNNDVFLSWIDINFFSFLVEFFNIEYLEYSTRVFKLFAWNVLVTKCFCVIYI